MNKSESQLPVAKIIKQDKDVGRSRSGFVVGCGCFGVIFVGLCGFYLLFLFYGWNLLHRDEFPTFWEYLKDFTIRDHLKVIFGEGRN